MLAESARRLRSGIILRGRPPQAPRCALVPDPAGFRSGRSIDLRRFACRLARSPARRLACSSSGLLARLPARPLARLLARLLACLLARSLARPLACLLACSLACSLARLLARPLARSPARLLACSPACLLARSPARLLACSLARLLACLLARSPARPLACLLACPPARPFAAGLPAGPPDCLLARSPACVLGSLASLPAPPALLRSCFFLHSCSSSGCCCLCAFFSSASSFFVVLPMGETGLVFRGGVLAGMVGGAVGGVPSTVWALVRGRDPLGAAVAAGRLLLPEERRRGRLLVAALPVHFGISAAWGVVLARILPDRGTVFWGAVAGGVIAGVDLRVPGRRAAGVRELEVLPQVVDHLVYGAAVGIYLRRRALRLP